PPGAQTVAPSDEVTPYAAGCFRRAARLRGRSQPGRQFVPRDGTGSSAEMVEIYWPEASERTGRSVVRSLQALSVSVVGDVLGPAMDGIGGLVADYPRGCGGEQKHGGLRSPRSFIYPVLRSAGSEQLRHGPPPAPEGRWTPWRTHGYQKGADATADGTDGSYTRFRQGRRKRAERLADCLRAAARPSSSRWTPAAVTGRQTRCYMFLLSARQETPSGRFTEAREGARVAGHQPARTLWKLLPALRRTPEWSAAAAVSNRCLAAPPASTSLSWEFKVSGWRDLTTRMTWRWPPTSYGGADLAGEGGDATKSLAKARLGGLQCLAESEVTAYGVLTALLAESSSEAAAAKAALPALQWLVSQADGPGRRLPRHAEDVQSTRGRIPRAIRRLRHGHWGLGPTRARIEIFAKAAAVAAPNSSTVVNIEPDESSRCSRAVCLAAATPPAEFSSVTVPRPRAPGASPWRPRGAGSSNLRDPERRSPRCRLDGELRASRLRLAAPRRCHQERPSHSACGARASRHAGHRLLAGGVHQSWCCARGLQLLRRGPLQIVFYFDRFASSRPGGGDVPVLDVQPQKITLQKYYNPELVNTVFYLDPALQSVGRCQPVQTVRDVRRRRRHEPKRPGQYNLA
uniref:RING-type domain-containing protein n=1 Tax=Macrostomum lignano TaxID=282301 RepID=A0A1I8F9A4_9PLAT